MPVSQLRREKGQYDESNLAPLVATSTPQEDSLDLREKQTGTEAEALASLVREKAVSELDKMLKNEDWYVRRVETGKLVNYFLLHLDRKLYSPL